MMQMDNVLNYKECIVRLLIIIYLVPTFGGQLGSWVIISGQAGKGSPLQTSL